MHALKLFGLACALAAGAFALALFKDPAHLGRVRSNAVETVR